MMFRFLFLIPFVPFLISSACADTTYQPSFKCPRPDNSDLLANMICENQDMAKADLVLSQVYYALRWQDGKSSYARLKEQAVKANSELRDTCHIPPAGTGRPLPDDTESCYLIMETQIAEEWQKQLNQAGREEASRNIDQHIAIQQNLINAGYLGGEADGIYGDLVREGIIRWQKAHNIEPNGFVTNQMVELLYPDFKDRHEKNQKIEVSENDNYPYRKIDNPPAQKVENNTDNNQPTETKNNNVDSVVRKDHTDSNEQENKTSSETTWFDVLVAKGIFFGLCAIGLLIILAWFRGLQSAIEQGSPLSFIIFLIFPVISVIFGLRQLANDLKSSS